MFTRSNVAVVRYARSFISWFNSWYIRESLLYEILEGSYCVKLVLDLLGFGGGCVYIYIYICIYIYSIRFCLLKKI